MTALGELETSLVLAYNEHCIVLNVISHPLKNKFVDIYMCNIIMHRDRGRRKCVFSTVNKYSSP